MVLEPLPTISDDISMTNWIVVVSPLSGDDSPGMRLQNSPSGFSQEHRAGKVGHMPGGNRFEPASASKLLDNLKALRSDIMELRPKVASGEVETKDALDRVLEGLLAVAAATEPLLIHYRRRHGD